YFARYRKVKEWLDATIEEARRSGRVKTLFGRRRYLPDINSKNPAARSAAERTAVNTPIQGTAADLVKRAMLRVDRALAARAPKAAERRGGGGRYSGQVERAVGSLHGEGGGAAGGGGIGAGDGGACHRAGDAAGRVLVAGGVHDDLGIAHVAVLHGEADHQRAAPAGSLRAAVQGCLRRRQAVLACVGARHLGVEQDLVHAEGAAAARLVDRQPFLVGDGHRGGVHLQLPPDWKALHPEDPRRRVASAPLARRPEVDRQ